MEPCLDGTSGGTLLREPEGLGGTTTFCVSIKGTEVFLSGGGGRDFPCCLLDVLLNNLWFSCDTSGKKIQQESCYDEYGKKHSLSQINCTFFSLSALVTNRLSLFS